MVESPDDLDPDEGNPDEGKVLSPEELDITESEHVTQLDEGRFVVSPDKDGGPGEQYQQQNTGDSESSVESRSGDQPETAQDANPQSGPQQEPAPQAGGEDLSLDVVHRWLRQDFEHSRSQYAFDVTAAFEGEVSQRRMQSNDVVTVFESLLLWYAQQVDSNTPVEEILGILLTESNVPVQYPTASLHKLVKSQGLGPEDTIADLLEAVDDDGFKL